MKRWILCSMLAWLAVMSGALAAAAKKAVIAYLFPENRLLQAKEIAALKLTHINYAFANIENGRIVQGFRYDGENLRMLNALKAANPVLQILISVGGWTWSGGFSDMALTPESRCVFIDSAISFLERHQVDGIDIDWEYPGLVGYGNPHRPEDKKNFTALLREMHARLDREGRRVKKRFLLTIAAGAFSDYLAHTEMQNAQKYLDFVNLMAYDQYEAEVDSYTGHHAPLFTNNRDPKANSAARAVSEFIAAGVPAKKIVLGVPFYGRGWSEVPDAENGLYQPGRPLAVRLDTSFRNIKANLVNRDGFVRHWDDAAKAPFLYNREKRMFISYDDEESIREKCRFVWRKRLAGIMFWEYGDDLQYCLIDTINNELRKNLK